MPHFPLFIDLNQKKILVVGAKSFGRDKIKRLLPFTANIVVVADKVDNEVFDLQKNTPVVIKRRKFRKEDLEGKDIVINAVPHAELQEEIFTLCTQKRILCNTVDAPRFCHFYFPSLITRGNLCIGLSTGGKAPSVAKSLREVLERFLPQELGDLVRKVSELRLSLDPGVERIRQVTEWTNDAFRAMFSR